MVIQHNIPALNAYRQLGINNSNLSGNLEKLSSGYRINRAADDAAGLAISEKMRAQITGLNRAVLNAQDGASLIQTAEGALTEVHSMLNRMVELATQSANGTIQADDRQKIEAEVTALKEEIDRISEATNFNGIQLLDGSLGGQSVNNVEISGLTFDSTTAGTEATYEMAAITNQTLQAGSTISFNYGFDDGTSATVEFTISADGQKMIAADGTEYAAATKNMQAATEISDALRQELQKQSAVNTKFEVSDNAGTLTFTANEVGRSQPQVLSATSKFGTAAAAPITITSTAGTDDSKTYEYTLYDGSNEETATFGVNGQQFIVVASPADAEKITDETVNVIVQDSAGAADAEAYARVAQQIAEKTGLDVTNLTDSTDPTSGVAGLVFRTESGEGLTMQVGVSSADFDQITVKVDDMSSTGLGINNISMASQETAAAALDKINFAIEKVSVNRGNLGALQNRLEHTMNNLNVTAENMTAAESRIRDVDMAKEMMDYTKNNVLSQAAQAMLAQANQQPQSVLQLLQ